MQRDPLSLSARGPRTLHWQLCFSFKGVEGGAGQQSQVSDGPCAPDGTAQKIGEHVGLLRRLARREATLLAMRAHGAMDRLGPDGCYF